MPSSPRNHHDPRHSRSNRDRDDLSPRSPEGNGDVEDLGRPSQSRLVRPDRSRPTPEDPNYHYYKKRTEPGIRIMPSRTGNVPEELDEDEEEQDSGTVSFESRRKSLNRGAHPDASKSRNSGGGIPTRQPSKRLDRKPSKRQAKVVQVSAGPSLWTAYCAVVTFWCPDAVLKCFGIKERPPQQAWREKMGLISIILMICAIVGFLTFGFTEVVCPSTTSVRQRVNHVGATDMIFHGQVYDLSSFSHPGVLGIPDGANVLTDLSTKFGGQDGSFLFQNVNGACKGLITAVPGSAVPTNSKNELGWYLPCNTFNQDGSTQPETGIDGGYYGYACHTPAGSRTQFYNMKPTGDVYFTWPDIKNSSRNLIVYGGDVIDINLLGWFNTSEVSVPDEFGVLRRSTDLTGTDITRVFSSARDRQIARCLSDIAKVGSVDTDTIGCIASKVVLYVSLIFILSIVAAKFVLALIFQWFLCRNFNPSNMDDVSGKKGGKAAVKPSDRDAYAAAPSRHGPAAYAAKRQSILPQTSRFTNVHETSVSQSEPVTMTTESAVQGSNARNTNSVYWQQNMSVASGFQDGGRMSMLAPPAGRGDRRSAVGTESHGAGIAGEVHPDVVPQSPPDWQPHGYPLAHTICLVTCYSEGQDGLRTTLNSIASTEYPNSHKLILVICDGMIKGEGELQTTPDIVLGMVKDLAVPTEDVLPYSYVAVASGSKRHNMAKIYSGFYDYGHDSAVAVTDQVRVPMMVVVKCGTAAETTGKPGNRGKRDSQIILMSFLQKVMYDERMTELEYEMFQGISYITGISPSMYEIVLMVDADTEVYTDSVTHMVSAMVKDPTIMGLCGETKISNKLDSWVTAIQVFEYFVSHHLSKSFESVFGGVTCLPGCFCMYRIKAPKGSQGYWVPILANPDIVEHYSENVVDTLHKKNLLLLGEDRYLTTLMLRTFPKRKQVFVPQAMCKTMVPDKFMVLLSQRRRWINSTVHNLMELVLVRDLCGTFCFSMQFVVFIELIGTLVLPAAISFTLYLIAISIKAAVTHTTVPVIPLILLGLILGLPAVLIVLTAKKAIYVMYMVIYLFSLPVWNFILPTYAFWKFDDFSWGDTRKTDGEKKGGHDEADGEFDSTQITMKKWGEFEKERRFIQHSQDQARQSQYAGGGSTLEGVYNNVGMGRQY